MAITEDYLEQLALTWFQDSGWEYRHGPDGDTPERADYRQVLLPATRPDLVPGRRLGVSPRLGHCPDSGGFELGKVLGAMKAEEQ